MLIQSHYSRADTIWSAGPFEVVKYKNEGKIGQE